MVLPNKIYVCEYKGPNDFDGQSHFVIVVAASDMQTARDFVKETIGIDEYPVWLMNAGYPTIYNSNGSKPLDRQAKILSNCNFHTYKLMNDAKV